MTATAALLEPQVTDTPATVPGTTMLEAALEWAARGYSVLPLHSVGDRGRCSCGHRCESAGKHPRVTAGTDFAAATTDEALIREWWSAWPQGNIGIPTGRRTNLLVIDLDTEGDEREKLEFVTRYGIDGAAVIVGTGSGGKHYWLRRPDFAGRLSHGGDGAPFGIDGIHFRCDGGMVVAPPSRNAAGEYVLLEAGFEELAPPPAELVELLANGQKRTAETKPDARIPQGQRNATLASLAGSMRRRGMTEEAIAAALVAENERRCDPPLAEEEVRRIAASVARYDPAPPREEPPPPGEADVPTRPSPVTSVEHPDPAPTEAPDPENVTVSETVPPLPVEASGFKLTDTGNAERLVAHHGADLRYCWPWQSWLVWDGRRWAKDEGGQVLARAKEVVRSIIREALYENDPERRAALSKWASSSESEVRRKSMVSLARSEPGVSVAPDKLDTNPWLLAVENGTLDLRTGELLPHDRRHLITKVAPVVLDPEAKCSRWDNFLWEIMDGDHDPERARRLIAFLQRAVGYSLAGVTTEQVFFLLYGSGQNGKSKFLNTIRRCLGDYATSASWETFLVRRGEGPRNDLADLRGTRFVSALEGEEGRRLAEAVVKALTGGDAIKARFLYSEHFVFEPEFALWLGTNHRPVIRDTTLAMWRRVRLVPFTVTIPEEKRDRDLEEKLVAEASGILNWALQGCREWRREGLGVPEDVRTATAAYQEESDPVAAFIDEKCVIREGLQVRVGDLYRSYAAWADANNERPLTNRAFSDRLTEKGLDAYRDKEARWRMGIGLGDASMTG